MGGSQSRVCSGPEVLEVDAKYKLELAEAKAEAALALAKAQADTERAVALAEISVRREMADTESHLRKELAEKDSRVAINNEKIEALNQEILLLRASLSEAANREKDLATRRQALHDELIRVQAEHSAAVDQLQDLAQRTKNNESQISDVKTKANDMESLRAALMESDRTKHDLEKQTRTLQDKVVSLEAVLHVVQSDIHHIRLQSIPMKSAMKSNATDGAAPSVTIQVPEAELDRRRSRNISLTVSAGSLNTLDARRASSKRRSLFKDVWDREREASLRFCQEQAYDMVQKISQGIIDPTNAVQMQEYTKRVHSQYAKTHRDLFIEIWDKYDVNKDGVMSQKECYALVRDALEASKRLMPQQLEDVIVNMLLIPLPKPVDDATSKAIRSKVHQLPIATMIQESASKLLGRAEDLAETLYGRMDKNSDKLVSRDEFLELYSQESSDLLTCNEEIIQSILFGVENAAEDISEEADGVPASPVRSLRQNT